MRVDHFRSYVFYRGPVCQFCDSPHVLIHLQRDQNHEKKYGLNHSGWYDFDTREMSTWYDFDTREMSTWYGFDTREMLRWYGFVPREKLRWYGFDTREMLV